MGVLFISDLRFAPIQFGVPGTCAVTARYCDVREVSPNWMAVFPGSDKVLGRCRG
jgi:hypothetical protein